MILGHSERRSDHGEQNADIAAKVAAAVQAGLRPIVCVGETLAQRAAGDTLPVVLGQLQGSLPPHLAQTAVFAYEPVWAIGTGETATPDTIAQVHGALRHRCTALFGDVGTTLPLLYGGSVKPDNAGAIFAVPHVNGALVGGASLKPDDFIAIMQALAAA